MANAALANSIKSNPLGFIRMVVSNNPAGVRNMLNLNGYNASGLTNDELNKLLADEFNGAIDGIRKDVISYLLQIPVMQGEYRGPKQVQPGIQAPNATAGVIAPFSNSKSIQQQASFKGYVPHQIKLLKTISS
jgi:hypothetical protein